MKEGILFISDSRESLPIAWRMQKEGIVDVFFYTHDPTYRNNFKGIMPTIGMGDLKRTLLKCDTVIFDITLPMRKPPVPRDVALLQLFGCSPHSPGVFGVISDKLRRRHRVIGGSQWAEHIELDREAGFKFAKKIGFEIPEYQKFKGLKQGIKFLENNKEEFWVFKMLNNGPLDLTYCDTFEGEILDLMKSSLPLRLQKEKFDPEKIEYILQKFVDGCECSNQLWWNGKEYLNPTRTIECKKLGSSNTGPATGSQSNTVSFCKDIDGPVFDLLQKATPYLELADCMIPMDANVIFASEPPHRPNWLEATFRAGWSALYCECAAIPNLTNFFLNGFYTAHKPGYVASQLLALYPYPDLDQKKLGMMVEGNLINHRLQDLDYMWLQDIYLAEDGKLRCSGADGIIGVITQQANTPEEAIDKVQDKCKKFEVSGNKMWRDDHKKKHTERINELRKWGIEF